MHKSRYIEEQIIGVLHDVEQGRKVADVCRDHGISHDTCYRWRRKYRGMEVADGLHLGLVERFLEDLRSGG